MDLISPQIGLIFWMVVTFVTALFILKKYAWKPILQALNDREKSIDEALSTARKAKEEMAMLKSDNEKLLAEARNERDKLLKEARETKDAIIAEAKSKAQVEVDRLMKQAREGIQTEKHAALNEIKNQVATLSIEIAEKILKQQLDAPEKQKALVSEMLRDISLN